MSSVRPCACVMVAALIALAPTSVNVPRSTCRYSALTDHAPATAHSTPAPAAQPARVAPTDELIGPTPCRPRKLSVKLSCATASPRFAYIIQLRNGATSRPRIVPSQLLCTDCV